MKKLLVRFNANWADEMDIEGFKVYNEKEWERIVEKVLNYKCCITVGFGTNEDNEYKSGKELLLEYSGTPITEEQASTLHELFGDSYGQFHDPEEMIDVQGGWEDEEQDELDEE